MVHAGNPVTAFTPYGCSATAYSNFLRSVAQASSAGHFYRPPIGPIGSQLTLTEDKWAAAVEIAIGRALNTFVVHDFADQATLKASISSCMSFQVEQYRLTSHRVATHHLG